MSDAQKYIEDTLPNDLRLINNILIEHGRKRKFDEGCEVALAQAVKVVQHIASFKPTKNSFPHVVLQTMQGVVSDLEKKDSSRAATKLEFLAKKIGFDY